MLWQLESKLPTWQFWVMEQEACALAATTATSSTAISHTRDIFCDVTVQVGAVRRPRATGSRGRGSNGVATAMCTPRRHHSEAAHSTEYWKAGVTESLAVSCKMK